VKFMGVIASTNQNTAFRLQSL